MTPRLLRLGTEFIVVVFGVLVALGADAWWDRRSERELERYYLEAISADLLADSVALRFTTDRVEAMRPLYLDSLVHGEGTFERDEAGPQIVMLRLGPALKLTSPTFDDLVSSGNLRVIRSPELRTALRGYYAQMGLAVAAIESRRPQVDFEQVVTTDAFLAFDLLLRSDGLTEQELRSQWESLDYRAILDEMSADPARMRSYLRLRHLYMRGIASELNFFRDSFWQPTMAQLRRELDGTAALD